jgi:hypothetical protein
MTSTAVELAPEFVPDYLVEVCWCPEAGPVGPGPHAPRQDEYEEASREERLNLFGDPVGGNIYFDPT